MEFDEWLEREINLDPSANSDTHANLLKLVRAQGTMIDKLMAKLAEEPGSVIVLGPNSRKLMDEIEDLEAALMDVK